MFRVLYSERIDGPPFLILLYYFLQFSQNMLWVIFLSQISHNLYAMSHFLSFIFIF